MSELLLIIWENIGGNMKTVCAKSMCAGCMACVDICPRHAISIEDTLKEYNALIDEEKCIECNLCHNTCPVNYTPELRKPVEWYEGWAEASIRKSSSSGGAATAFILAFEGIICSCVFREGRFIFEFDEGDRKKFAGSKYIKSNPKGAYKNILKKLKEGNKVLFVGMPCQCAAVINYTKNHRSLYTIDLICHGSPSPQLLDIYLKEKGLEIEKISNIKFRRKARFGLNSEHVEIVPPRVMDSYTYAFLKSLDYTENCYLCKYARLERVTDITIGDSWGSDLDIGEQEKGISLVLCQTEKGKELIEKSGLILKDVNLDKATEVNHQLSQPSIAPKCRNKFFSNLGVGFNEAISAVYPKFYYKQKLKIAMIRFGLLKSKSD